MKRKASRLPAGLLAVIMVLFMMPVSMLTAFAADISTSVTQRGYLQEIPDGFDSSGTPQHILEESVYMWKGSGTEADPYLLSTPDDMQALYDYVASGENTEGIFFCMTADIALPDGWASIGVRRDSSISHINDGKNMYAFSGVLDGNGHLVTVPEGGVPLFGYVKGAVVRNLNIYGSRIAGYGLVDHLEGVNLSGEAILIDHVTLKSGTQTLKSGLIGTYITNNRYAGCSHGFYVTIRDCTVEKDVVIGYNKDQLMIGSFASRVNGTIENCVSYAKVYGTSYVGGILGTRDNSLGTCAVSGCTFEGIVEASDMYAGGIVGGGYGNSTAPNGNKVDITNCTVKGTMTGTDRVGGIVGGDGIVVQLWGAHTLKNNSFSGSVTATKGTAVGGIIGHYASLNKYDDIAGNYYTGIDRGIGSVQYVDTSCETHETESGATYINTAKGLPGINNIIRTDHNRTDDPLGKDASKLCYTDSISVNVSVLGDILHDCEADGKVHTLADGNLSVWVPEKEYTVSSNATVLDVLNSIFEANGITASNPSGNYIESLTKDGVTIEEFANGPNSGWMFTVNGVHRDKGVSEQYLESGDKIIFHYTDDYTREKYSGTPDQKPDDQTGGNTTGNGTSTGDDSSDETSAACKITLSKSSYTYNGKTQKPGVTVKNRAGKKLKFGTDYTVTYPKSMKNVGKYTVTVKLKGSYSGTLKADFKIIPKSTSISKLTARKKEFTVEWKKQAEQTTGYEIAYSMNKKFPKKDTKTITIKKNKTVSRKVTKLKTKKKYYVRIRTYKTVKVNKKPTKIYSAWSKVKSVTAK